MILHFHVNQAAIMEVSWEGRGEGGKMLLFFLHDGMFKALKNLLR